MCLSYPARVVSLEDVDVAIVDIRGTHRRVPLVVVVADGTTVAPGDWLLVQTGLAVAQISPAEAAQRLALIEQGVDR